MDCLSFLVPILSPLATNHYTVKDTFSFVRDILSVGNTAYMSSFDVVNIFTNIPLFGNC